MIPILLAAAACLCAQDAVDLKLSLPKEKTLRARLAVEEDSASVAGGGGEKLQDRGGWELGLESKGSPGPGLSRIHVTILRITRSYAGRAIDTAKPGAVDPPEASFLRALVGEAVDVDVAPDGSIREVLGMAELEAHFSGKLGVKPGQEGGRRAAKNIEGRLREQLAGILSVYPSAPASGPWTRKQSVVLGADYQAETTWALEARKESRLFLKGKAALSPFDESSRPGVEFPTLQKLRGTGEGDLELDAETGFPLQGKIVHRLSGTSTVKGIPNPRPSDTFEVTTQVTFTLGAWDGK